MDINDERAILVPNMNEDNQADTSRCCAFCGIAEIDDIKLRNCTACYLVKYCSIKCQKDHRPKHKRECKKRAAELRDELLFQQPESSHLGDCPICFIPLQLDTSKSIINLCCSKVICKGCNFANKIREAEERIEHSCPFCRQPIPAEDEREKQRMKRLEANDPAAMTQWGLEQYNKGEYSSAFEYFTKAAQLGDAESHYQLSILYHHGRGVEKDKVKEIYYTEEAAIRGHPPARYNLGAHEGKNGNNERAVKHWIIAAKLGDDDSIKPLMHAFRSGLVEKEELTAALRAHQAAVDATKSAQRDAAEEYRRKWSGVEPK